LRQFSHAIHETCADRICETAQFASGFKCQVGAKPSGDLLNHALFKPSLIYRPQMAILFSFIVYVYIYRDNDISGFVNVLVWSLVAAEGNLAKQGHHKE